MSAAPHAGKYADLAVLRLPETSAVLLLDPDGAVALLHESRFVQMKGAAAAGSEQAIGITRNLLHDGSMVPQ